MGDTLAQTLNQNTTYYVQTVSYPCESEQVAVTILVDPCDEPKGSNVFSPNGDGLNDGWSLEILGATCYEVEIYNRWGMLIYTLTSNGASWDGTIEKSQMDAPEGTYYYLLSYCDYKEDTFRKRGYISLVR